MNSQTLSYTTNAEKHAKKVVDNTIIHVKKHYPDLHELYESNENTRNVNPAINDPRISANNFTGNYNPL